MCVCVFFVLHAYSSTDCMTTMFSLRPILLQGVGYPADLIKTRIQGTFGCGDLQHTPARHPGFPSKESVTPKMNAFNMAKIA